MFWFTPDGNDETPQNFQVGDVPTWDGERWIAQQPSGGAQTWGEVLAEGNGSDGTSPAINNGDALFFEGQGLIIGDDTLSVTVPNGIVFDTESILFANDVSTPIIGFVDRVAGNGTSLAIRGQTPLQNNSDGGDVEILAGSGTGNGAGGGLHISPGISDTGDNGSLNITNGSGTSMFFIDGSFTPVSASPAITITDGGIKFWDGTAAERPVVTDATELLVALDAMGLITYTP